MTGKLVHFEIPAQDSAKAQEFWGGLFGWQFQPAFPDMDYHVTRIDDASGAAITGMDPDLVNGRAYFDVEDVNAGAARVKELGGEAGDAMPVPGMGWFVVCKDVSGNEFGLWQTDSSAQAPEQ